MITPEQLIRDLQKENERLKEELNQTQSDLEDFESMAKVWMQSYNEEVPKLKKRIMELEQVVEELDNELKEKRSEPN